MALKHTVYDTDAHFKIDPITHMIKNESSNKNVLIQHDHNSERFTFEIPRMVDGHDMSKCDVVQIHYINIDSQDKNNTSKDAHDVDDLQISPDGDDVVICSWLIDGNATKYAGSLNFLVKFKCIGDDGSACYVWNTAIFTGIFVSPGIDNGEAITEDYSDVLEQWRKELDEGAEKTHYTERVQVLAQTNLEYDEDMNAFTYPEHLHLIAGQEYTVRWNGVEYVCTAYEISEWSAMGLGDFASAGVPSVAPSNEPFAIGETKDDPPVVFVPLDGSTKVTISIYRDVIHKLDNKYLDLDWIPKKTGTVILPAQIARLNNGVVSVEAIDAAYRVNGTKINVLIDGIHHDTEIHVDGNDIYANIEYGYDNRVMILFSTTRTFMVGKNLDGRTVEIWLDDAVCSKIPVEYLPDGYNPAGSGGSSAPSDWNANEGEPGHVLNRTHYRVLEDFIPEITIPFDANGTYQGEYTGDILLPGERYLATWGGAKYECEAVIAEYQGAQVVAIGNVDAFLGIGNSGEPFVLATTVGAVLAAALDGSSSKTVRVQQYGYKPLEIGYLSGMHYVLKLPEDIDFAVDNSTDKKVYMTDTDGKILEALLNHIPVYVEFPQGDDTLKAVVRSYFITGGESRAKACLDLGYHKMVNFYMYAHYDWGGYTLELAFMSSYDV